VQGLLHVAQPGRFVGGDLLHGDARPGGDDTLDVSLGDRRPNRRDLGRQLQLLAAKLTRL
jgi:hypothetical protein